MTGAARRFRPKLPAYGAELLHARKAGRHPARVWVIYGAKWDRRPADAPSVCVSPLAWAPGELAWSVVAGVRVDIINRDDVASAYPFAAEIAAHAAPVYLWSRWPMDAEDCETWPDAPGDTVREDIADAAFCWRRWDAEARLMRWPAWWGDELEADYRARSWDRFKAEVRQLERQREQHADA